MRSALCGCTRWGSAGPSASRRGSAPRRSCLARMAAMSTNRNRLSIGGAFGRGAGGASDSVTDPIASLVSIRTETTSNRRDQGTVAGETWKREGVRAKSDGRDEDAEVLLRIPDPRSPSEPASYAATSTLTVRGFASSRNGSLTVRMPFLYSAPTFDASTVFGSVNDRLKAP